MRRLLSITFLALAAVSGTLLAQYSTPVRDVENPSQNPYWAVGWGESNQGIVNFIFDVGTVPAGKRLTLDFVSINCITPETDSISIARITVFKKPGTQYEVPIHVARQGTDAYGKATWVGSQTTKLYLDNIWSPTTIKANIYHKNWADVSGSASCVVNLAGSLVSAP